MRRSIRRATRFAFDLGLEENLFPEIIATAAVIHAYDFSEVAGHVDTVGAVLSKEEHAFRRSLRKGVRQLT